MFPSVLFSLSVLSPLCRFFLGRLLFLFVIEFDEHLRNGISILVGGQTASKLLIGGPSCITFNIPFFTKCSANWIANSMKLSLARNYTKSYRRNAYSMSYFLSWNLPLMYIISDDCSLDIYLSLFNIKESINLMMMNHWLFWAAFLCAVLALMSSIIFFNSPIDTVSP